MTRFCGLARLPTRRTVANWLRQFTQETLAPLVALNRDLVTEALARLDLPRLTIDVDGSVIRTGATVGWAFRGFNPHHRKDPSYYPLLAHVAQTGHILRLKNRPGNVHDSKQAVPFLRELIDDLRAPARPARGPGVPHGRGLLPARDSAPARRPGLRLRDQGRVLELAAAQGDRGRLPPLAAGRPGRHRPRDRAGHPAVERPAAPRGRSTGSTSHHETRRNFQLDLFTPDDGHYEYSAVATNLALGPRGACGPSPAGAARRRRPSPNSRASSRSTSSRPSTTRPTAPGSNSSILAHNLIRSFQLETLAEPKPRSRKRTYAYLFRSMRTLRFLLIARAGRLTRLGGRNVLRLTKNPATEALYGQIAHRLAA